jgi:Ca-activated chloride channel family protein
MNNHVSSGRWSARTERTLIRATGGSERFVLIELTAPSARREPGHRRPQANLAFVLDRSGSMGGSAKFDLARQGVLEGLRRLDRDDRFCVVVYDNEIDVVVASTLATREAIQLAERSLAAIEPRGSTDLGGGWLRGAEQVASHLSADGVNRVLLLTDGLANVGIQSADELAKHAAELRSRGVATSTIGVGNDFDEALLQAMADAGGGHFYFAGSMPEILDHLTSEVGEALDVTVRDAVLNVTAPAGVSVRTLTPHPITDRGERSSIRLGDLVSDQAVRVVIRLKFPEGTIDSELGVLLSVSDPDGELEKEGGVDPLGLAWRFASDHESDAQARDLVVDRAVAELFASRARQEALQLNRKGDWIGARVALEGVARKIKRYAASDPELQAIVHRLSEVEAPMMAAPMQEATRKQAYFAASNIARGRDERGKSAKRA